MISRPRDDVHGAMVALGTFFLKSLFLEWDIELY